MRVGSSSSSGLWIFISKIGLLDFSFWGFLFPSILLFVGGMLVYRALKPPRVEVTFDPEDAPSRTRLLSASAIYEQSDADLHARMNEHLQRKFGSGTTLKMKITPNTFVLSPMLSGSELRPMSRPFRGADLSAAVRRRQTRSHLGADGRRYARASKSSRSAAASKFTCRRIGR